MTVDQASPLHPHEPDVPPTFNDEGSCLVCRALVRAAITERQKALTEAWQAVDRAIRPLGYGGGATNSPWNKGYEQAKDEALNAILAMRDAT